MAGRHSFARLRAGLPPEGRARAEALTDEMDRELSLAELRRARALMQDQLAADLHVGQASIAKLERRTDMYLSTLRRFVEAMGVSWRSWRTSPTSTASGCAASVNWPKATAHRTKLERARMDEGGRSTEPLD